MINSQLKEIFIDILHLTKFSENINRTNIPSWDSLNHIKLIITLQNKFNIKFSIEEIASMQSYSEIKRKIKNENN